MYVRVFVDSTLVNHLHVGYRQAPLMMMFHYETPNLFIPVFPLTTVISFYFTTRVFYHTIVILLMKPYISNYPCSMSLGEFNDPEGDQNGIIDFF